MKFRLILFLIVLVPLISFSKEIELFCMINKELENNIPARKNLFIGKKIPLYLNKEESWLYEIKIILFKQTMEMIYLKEYYNNNKNKYFSSEIRGICK